GRAASSVAAVMSVNSRFMVPLLGRTCRRAYLRPLGCRRHGRRNGGAASDRAEGVVAAAEDAPAPGAVVQLGAPHPVRPAPEDAGLGRRQHAERGAMKYTQSAVHCQAATTDCWPQGE